MTGFELIISKKKGQEFSSIKEENKAINLRTSKEDCSRRNSSYTRGESAFGNCAHCGDGVARGVVIRYTGDTMHIERPLPSASAFVRIERFHSICRERVHKDQSR
jgi:hypothetical protein